MKNKSNLLGRLDVKAFTLIELLVVVLIIGILAAVALPQYQKAVWKSRFVQAKTMAKALANAEEIYYLANGNYTMEIGELAIEFPNVLATAATSDTEQKITFSWGYCSVRIGSNALARCALNKSGKTYLEYSARLEYSTTQGPYCVAYGSNEAYPTPKDVNYQICAADTNKTTHRIWGANSHSYYWGY